jgi:CheY-like chemotaxis protein
MSRVLIVEDESLIRLHAVELITEAGHEVIEAENADEGKKGARVICSRHCL